MIDTLDPFDGRPYRHRVGLRPLDPSTWLIVDDRAAADVAQKERLLATVRQDVCRGLPGSEAASEELVVAIADSLRTYHPGWWERYASAVVGSDLPAIDRCGLLTQEDWCVMEGDPLVLTAGAVCFPNRWRVTENLGLQMRGIHAPVPGYDAQLGGPADQALERVTPERPVWRLNWSLSDNPTLHQPQPDADPEMQQQACDDVGARVYLRQERQTLIRLRVSGAVVFGIRTFVRPLGDALATAQRRAKAAVVLRSLPDDVTSYKSIGDLRGPVLAWLESRPSED